MQKKGFTLIELLVVIAIISLLMSVIVPSLRMAKRKASAAVCLAHIRQLTLGWYAYQQDADGRIMSAEMYFPNGPFGKESDGHKVGWIGKPHPGDGTDPYTSGSEAISVDDVIRGIRDGVLHRYLEAPKTYHCPGDNIRKSVDSEQKVFVSYGIARCMYGDPGGSFSHQIKRFTEIKLPSDRYVFVEVADERHFEKGRFTLAAPEYPGCNPTPGRYGWWGPMAVNHGDSGTLGFADGHAENHKWRDSFTLQRAGLLHKTNLPNYKLVYPGETDIGGRLWPADQTTDIEYMARGWAYK